MYTTHLLLLVEKYQSHTQMLRFLDRQLSL